MDLCLIHDLKNSAVLDGRWGNGCCKSERLGGRFTYKRVDPELLVCMIHN